ncbi:MAG: SIMPL domain-containing protein [Nanoarchaeota archaeon]
MELGKNAVLVILVVALLAIGAYVYTNTGFQRESVTVSGDAEIPINPDYASVYISIETLNDSAQDSKDSNSAISEKVMGELKILGFSDKDIETINYNMYPDYSWENNQQKLKGYKTVNLLKVKMSDFDKVGNAVDAAADNGALIQSINFELSPENENKAKANAIEAATKDAKLKAEAVAKGSGKRLGRLVSISTSDYRYYPYMAYEKTMDASVAGNAIEARSAITQINPQELKVYANVQAVYAI